MITDSMKTDIHSFDSVLDAKYGAPGTKSRAEAEEAALAYYSGLHIKKARKEVHLTQSEFATKPGTDTALKQIKYDED